MTKNEGDKNQPLFSEKLPPKAKPAKSLFKQPEGQNKTRAGNQTKASKGQASKTSVQPQTTDTEVKVLDKETGRQAIEILCECVWGVMANV